MSYPASTKLLQRALDEFDGIALRIKSQVQTLRNRSAGGTTKISEYVHMSRLLDNAVEQWDRIITDVDTAKFREYVRAQKNNLSVDVIAEGISMRAQAVQLSDWIKASVPSEDLSTVQTAAFRTRADSFTGTIG